MHTRRAWRPVGQAVQLECTPVPAALLRSLYSYLDRAGVDWEEVPPHTGKLFPYEEHSAITILKLVLTDRHGV